MIKYKSKSLSPLQFSYFVNKCKTLYKKLPKERQELLGDFYGFGEPIFTKTEISFRLKNSKGDSFYECLYSNRKIENSLLQTDVEWYDEFVKNIIEVYENTNTKNKMRKQTFKAEVTSLSVEELKDKLRIKQIRAKKAAKEVTRNTKEAQILWEVLSEKTERVYSTTEIAKNLHTSAQMLNKFLESEKIIYKVEEKFSTTQKLWKIAGNYLHLVKEERHVFDSASNKGLKRQISTIKWNETGKYLIEKLWREKVASPVKAILMEV